MIGNAIHEAKTPNMDKLIGKKNKHIKKNFIKKIHFISKIEFNSISADASGLAVGLPEGVMGNSEVGHLTIGAGRQEYQDLVRINKSIKENKFGSIPVLQNAFENAKKNGNKIHFLGLVSDGGVHSHQGEKKKNLKKILISQKKKKN